MEAAYSNSRIAIPLKRLTFLLPFFFFVWKKKKKKSKSSENGGFIYVATWNTAAQVVITNSVISNSTSKEGGAVYFYQLSRDFFVVTGSTFENNSADQGGAIFVANQFSIPIIQSTLFINNFASFGSDITSPPLYFLVEVEESQVVSNFICPFLQEKN